MSLVVMAAVGECNWSELSGQDIRTRGAQASLCDRPSLHTSTSQPFRLSGSELSVLLIGKHTVKKQNPTPPPKNPRNESNVNTNKQLLPMVC